MPWFERCSICVLVAASPDALIYGVIDALVTTEKACAQTEPTAVLHKVKRAARGADKLPANLKPQPASLFRKFKSEDEIHRLIESRRLIPVNAPPSTASVFAIEAQCTIRLPKKCARAAHRRQLAAQVMIAGACVPMFSPYGSACCACARRPGLRARARRSGWLAALALHAGLSAHVAFAPARAAPGLLAHADVTKNIKYFSMGPIHRYPHGTCVCVCV